MTERAPSAHDLAGLDAAAHAAAVRGSLLFHLLLAETLAGDVFAAAPIDGVTGWAIDIGSDGYEVTALGDAETLRRVTFAADGSPITETGGDAPSARQMALAAARETGMRASRSLGSRFAAVAIPPPRGALASRESDVYLVRLPERPEDLAAGPHRRLRIDPEARDVLETTAACSIDLIVPDAARLAGSGLVLAHADGAVPSELHVFLSLRHGFAFDVVTTPSRLRWRVDGERLARV